MNSGLFNPNGSASATAIILDGADHTTQSAPTPGQKKAITIDTMTKRGDISHTLGTPNFTINVAGWYSIKVIPEFETGGGGSGVVEVSWEIDTGGGFALIADSTVADSIASNSELIVPCELVREFSAGDMIRAMWATDSSSINLTGPTSIVGDTIASAHIDIVQIL